ncbi:MAG: ribonuclease R [Mollicutes bacterium]|jgi:ribonuclease R|nr:ribonuclease R [Mollicutes bacterium]
MKKQIIEILKLTNKKMTISDIANSLKDKDEDKILHFLNELEKEYLVYKTNKNKYMLFEKNEYYRVGIVSLNKKGFGFLENPNYEDDLFIPAKHLNGAVDEDKVLVSVDKTNNSAKVIKIIKRDLNNLVGEVIFEKNKAYVILDDGRKSLKILLKDPKVKDCVTGTKVKIEMLKERSNSSYTAKIIKIIGHKNDPGVDIKSISLRYGFDEEFNDEVMNQVNKIPTEVLENEKNNRTDLTNKIIFTIDGDDTKDIDDALSLEKNGDLYKLGVHIADVSHYVTENSPLDKEALKRGTSAYLADSVIPMLPHKLSNGICSLNPEQVRIALTCEMDIDNQGNVKNYKIFPSIIKSRIQMTYKKVNDILMRDIVAEGYEQYKETLLLMNELAKILRKNKELRGNLDFDLQEAKVIVNSQGEAIDIVLRTREDGEKLIEDFMIVANETVASHIFKKNLPFVYRTHEKPSPEKVDEFLKLAVSFGYSQTELTNYEPLGIQKILNEVNELENGKILSNLLLRSMRKALYTKENIGHFGLASTCYTHFTSPIRRYPDLTVHRLLRRYVFENNKETDKLDKKLTFIAENSSLREQAAIDAEREVLDMKMAEYMYNYIGDIFEGTISGVMNFGFFVALPNLVEGLVHISSLTDDHYTSDEANHVIVGEHHGKRYRLGDRVTVKLIRASKESREIDFEIYTGDNNGN